MDDSRIIELFFARSEQAVKELSAKYGAVCSKVAGNILRHPCAVEECLNDAYLGVWNTIPPQKPERLLAYVCRIVRNISIAKYHALTAAKRNSQYDTALAELEDCFASVDTVESEVAAKELTNAVNGFLATLDQESRVMFVRRYWYADSVTAIAARLKRSENSVSVRLFRMREKLKNYLKKEGYEL